MTTEKTPVKTIEYATMAGPDRRIFVRTDYGDIGGQVAVPYLAGGRQDDGSVFLTLDDRLGLTIPATLSEGEQDSIVEFIANAIAVGGGYASIYFTDRKMPFR